MPDTMMQARPINLAHLVQLNRYVWPEGSLLTAPPSPQTYVVQGGQRHLIPNEAVFVASGFSHGNVTSIDIAQLNAVPLGEALPLLPTTSFDSGNQDLGAGHFMRTWGTLDRNSGSVAAETRLFSVTELTGLHAGVHVIVVDANGGAVWTSGDHRYGVDGRLIGQSDKTASWTETMTPNQSGRASQIYIFEAWEPDSFLKILNKWVADAGPISTLVADVGAVAKVIAALI